MSETSTPRRLRRGLGIDPGKVNLGAAVVEDCGVHIESPLAGMPNLTLLGCRTSNPSSSLSLENSVVETFEWAGDYKYDSAKKDYLTLERYAAYQGVVTSESENITSLIGIYRGFYFAESMTLPTLYRAIDWKIKLVQLLNSKYGFENPSTKLDKKFSLAAAKFIITTNKELITNDHEADATCLAAMPFLFPGS